MISIVAYALFYMMSVFSLSWGTSALGYTRNEFLVMQLFAILFFAATIPISGILAESGRRRAMIWMTLAAVGFGFVMPTLFAAGTAGAVTMLCLGFGVDRPGLRSARARCCRSCSRPRSATPAARSRSTSRVSSARRWRRMRRPGWRRITGCSTSGYYISGVAMLSLVGLIATKETKDTDLRQ